MYDKLIKRLRSATTLPVMNALCQEAADAIEELSRLHEAQRQNLIALMNEEPEMEWIPVTERLPKDNEAVNVTWINRDPASYYQHIKDKPFVATGVYYRGQWYWWSSVVEDYLAEYGKCDFEKIDEAIDITHWMPLPEPPKEE